MVCVSGCAYPGQIDRAILDEGKRCCPKSRPGAETAPHPLGELIVSSGLIRQLERAGANREGARHSHQGCDYANEEPTSHSVR